LRASFCPQCTDLKAQRTMFDQQALESSKLYDQRQTHSCTACTIKDKHTVAQHGPGYTDDKHVLTLNVLKGL